MGWIRIPDWLFMQPNWIQASKPARGLWITALSYSASQKTKGEITFLMLPILGGSEQDAQSLVSVGLWQVTDKGWSITNYLTYAGVERDDSYRAYQEEVFARDGYACVYCGSPLNLTLDHIIPQSRGGSHEPVNLCTCCRSCNSSKGARTPEEWMASRVG